MRAAPTILVALAASAATAAAQPMTTTTACEVRFVRAPDDVRHVIESWLAAEPRCSSTIDVRVIPTDDGYYVMGQRPDGRVYERVVPDAQSAGVLVASWVADDWVAPRAPAAPVVMQPVRAAPSDVGLVDAVPAPRRRGPTRWLTAGAMFSPDRGQDGGLRGELDLFLRGNWSLGAALAYAQDSMIAYNGFSYARMTTMDIRATVYGAFTLGRDRWQVRFALGAGAAHGEIDGDLSTSSGPQYVHGTGLATIAEGSALITRRVGDRWGITAGLIGTLIEQRTSTDDGMTLARSDAQVMLFAGLRRQL